MGAAAFHITPGRSFQMYRVTSGIHIQFGHHVRGHAGPCISLHGHTWLFQVTLEAATLNNQSFVADFDEIFDRVLTPCHLLLDHSLALGEQSFAETQTPLASMGETLVASRREISGNLGQRQPALEGTLAGARNEWPGGIKVAVFPFTPTSERLAEWLYRATHERMADERVRVASTRIYETLHPVESHAEYLP